MRNFDGRQILFQILISKVVVKPSESGEYNCNKFVNSSKSQLIELMFEDTQKQKAEIIWALKTVMSNYSNNSSLILSRVFLCFFPDSIIVQSIELGPRKLR